jgi:uncharacterized cupredoxin-like copper-binding protein
MARKSLLSVGIVSVLCSGVLLSILATGAFGAHNRVGSRAAKTTVITVTAGKPSELAFKLSKFSSIPAGTVTFKVTNKGAIAHDFKICTSPAANSSKNSCTGEVTKMLKPGTSATLTVKLSKTGKYEYLCTVPGHAGAGMKGLIGVGVKVTAPAVAQPTTTSKTSTTTGGSTSPSSTTTAAATCASPKSTTVTVNEFDFGFTLSTSTVPCGSVTFVQTNTGQAQHNFDINAIAAAAGDGAYINPGQNTTMTVQMTPGTYSYECDVPTHAALGMVGQLTVTG